MGFSLPSHIDSGLIFGLLGLWHIVNTLHLYIVKPKAFRSRAWFPAPEGFPSALRCGELWILLAIVLYFITIQLSHALQDIGDGVIQARHLMRFQHAAFSMFYLVYIVVALIHENTTLLPLPHGALQATFGLGFLMELVIFHYGHHPGQDLESHVHLLMQLILATLVLLMLLEIQFPHSPIVAIGRAMCLTFKGTWFFHIGLVINYPFAVPIGCSMTPGHDFPQCPSPMDEMRAKALQVLVFCSQAVGIVIFTFTAYASIRFVVRSSLDATALEQMDKEQRGDYVLVDNGQKEFDLQVDAAGVPLLKTMPRSISRRSMSSKASVLQPLPELVTTPVTKMANSPMHKNIKNV
ncbi:hypothetical protein MPTK1_5g11410 [Marchantia polymorpha subsp. ruderalis]|uniref:Uncharacterized protein n=2 Tax=Marchantia polymorpha TaxID=3197 RepID=A0AAF6BH96_MARPO|nr:hypothetical protein MARPO_0093s0064 [Marchantia polymorpha]BBN11380.1 hypothetical protein Mp_5g11410 [Marchantia polymorpha subsp. ruderalis]|eukprot:PTQ32993.1 hypothetical protein MARPO_0093s0064 [Marchantia polymorpha]